MDDELAQSGFKFQLGQIAKLGRNFSRVVIDALVPPQCLICKTFVSEGACLCMACWQKLNFLEHPVCDVLGTPFAYDQGEGILSAAALADPPPWQKSRAAVVFDDGSKSLVHALKYRDHAEAALFMAQQMARAGRDLLTLADVIVPVPLHATRLWKRRFNQAASLAKPLSRTAHKPYLSDILVRRLATRQQVGLDATARQKNVRKAFTVVPTKAIAVQSKTVLLVDDVRTTGATLAACTTALLQAGAAQVLVLTFALVLEPHRFHIDA